MISGNLLDLLSRVDGVASDLTFQGALGAPTFRVSSLDIA
jgi:predicted Zn-dependent protease